MNTQPRRFAAIQQILLTTRIRTSCEASPRAQGSDRRAARLTALRRQWMPSGCGADRWNPSKTTDHPKPENGSWQTSSSTSSSFAHTRESSFHHTFGRS